MVFVEGPRGRDGNHPLARAVQWHGARAALHRLGDGAAVCVRLRKRHRIGSRGVVLIEIPCQAVAGDKIIYGKRNQARDLAGGPPLTPEGWLRAVMVVEGGVGRVGGAPHGGRGVYGQPRADSVNLYWRQRKGMGVSTVPFSYHVPRENADGGARPDGGLCTPADHGARAEAAVVYVGEVVFGGSAEEVWESSSDILI